MTKIVFNASYGGFGLSDKAMERYATLKGWALTREDGGGGCSTFYKDGEYLSEYSIPRTDPHLIQVIEELGQAANGQFANLKIADVPAGHKYRIEEYDGSESVMEIDDYEWSIA